MARAALPPPVLFFIVLLFLNSGPSMKLIRGQEQWCIAKPSTGDVALINNIEYACTYVDCSPIQKDGPCFNPNTLISHASVAMNLYYQEMGRNFWNCNFTNSALVAIQDPSIGDCKYPMLG